jgi:hypothetical protein
MKKIGTKFGMAIKPALLACAVCAFMSVPSARAQAAFKALIGVDGMYQIASTNLAVYLGVSTAQAEAWLAAKQVAVENQGRLLPALYGSNSISFYASRYESRYTALNTYWIRNAAGLQMVDVSSAPAGLSSGQTFLETRKVEQNLVINTDIFFNQDDDPWLWRQLSAAASNPNLYTLTSVIALPGATVGDSMVVRVMPYLPSGSNVVSVSVSNVFGNVVVGSFLAQGSLPVVWTGNISGVTLSPSNNTVRIAATTPTIQGGQDIYVDKYEIRYRRQYLAVSNELVFAASSNDPITVSSFTAPQIELFDVTDPSLVKRVSGVNIGGSAGNYNASFRPTGSNNRYLAVAGGLRRTPAQLVADFPSNLRAPSNASDYLAIYTPAFSNSAQILVNYRTSHGLSSRLVDLQDIYDEYNYGIADPRAVRAFLGSAYYTWSISPRYVAFIGEGSLDYRNFLGAGDCVVPPLVAADYFGIQASDEPMGDFNGDGATEIAIGRFPVASTQEFEIIYSKLQSYELGGDWKTQMVCLADVPDAAGNFELDNDYVSSITPVHLVEKNYIAQQPTQRSAHTNLIESLNKGRGIMTYFGHGNEVKLTSTTNILVQSDVFSLTNKSKPSLVMTMTCLAGDFGTPNVDSLGETFLVASNGAVAVWAAGKQQFDADGRALAAAFVSNLFVAGSARVGDGIIAATAANTDRVYACQAYNLLGDPALAAGNINAPRPGPYFPTNGPSSYTDWKAIAMAPVVLDLGVGIGENDDADGDGILNKDEYSAGTDPLDFASKLVITHVSKPGTSQSLVKWNSATRKKYDLERTTNILTGTYVPVAYDINASPVVNVFTDGTTTASGPFFYRVRAK